MRLYFYFTFWSIPEQNKKEEISNLNIHLYIWRARSEIIYQFLFEGPQGQRCFYFFWIFNTIYFKLNFFYCYSIYLFFMPLFVAYFSNFYFLYLFMLSFYSLYFFFFYSSKIWFYTNVKYLNIIILETIYDGPALQNNIFSLQYFKSFIIIKKRFVLLFFYYYYYYCYIHNLLNLKFK